MAAPAETEAGKLPAPAPQPEGTPEPPQGREREERLLRRLARAIVPSSLGAIGFEIPWQQRLSTKLFGMIAAVALGMVAAFFLAGLAVQRHLLVQVVEESDLLSATIRNALLRAMLHDRRPDAYAMMEDIARQPGIERVRMLDA